VRLAFSLGLGVAGLSVVLSIALGAGAAIANAVFLLCGWLYNVRLKRSVLSPLPYLLGFGAIPAIVTLSLPEPMLPPWWAVTAGALIGLAAHFANVLTDLDADLARGVRGLPQRLGARTSAVVSVLALLAASLLLVGAGAEGAQWLIGILAVAAAAACFVVALRHPRSRLLFRLVIVIAALDVALLIGVGTNLTG
jgi:4-hydroxybenzoate polyprenyltransferase